MIGFLKRLRWLFFGDKQGDGFTIQSNGSVLHSKTEKDCLTDDDLAPDNQVSKPNYSTIEVLSEETVREMILNS